VRPRLLPRADLVAPLELLEGARRGRLGQLSREEEVPRVPARDVHDLAAQAELVHVCQEDDLHGS
jgi:hypothetical protein